MRCRPGLDTGNDARRIVKSRRPLTTSGRRDDGAVVYDDVTGRISGKAHRRLGGSDGMAGRRRRPISVVKSDYVPYRAQEEYIETFELADYSLAP